MSVSSVKQIKSMSYDAFSVVFHPFKGFYELKYENKGRLSISLIFLTLYFFSVSVKDSLSGYLFNENAISGFSIVICLFKAIVPITLFCLANWCLTLVLNGEATYKQLFIADMYALVPMIIYNFLFTFLSNVFSLDESIYLNLFFCIAMIWTGFLLITAVMETNQYSFGKAVLSCILAIIGIAVLILLFLLCFDLIGQIFYFLSSVIKEISYR